MYGLVTDTAEVHSYTNAFRAFTTSIRKEAVNLGFSLGSFQSLSERKIALNFTTPRKTSHAKMELDNSMTLQVMDDNLLTSWAKP